MKMTATQLKTIVTQVANTCFVRYWLHWNYPATPEIMAIAFVAYDGKNAQMYEADLISKGFKKHLSDRGLVYWLIERDWKDDKTP